MKGIISIFLGSVICNLTALHTHAQKITEVFDHVATIEVGQTTFRTNLYFDGKHIFVPTNNVRNIASDHMDGVLMIDGKSKKIVRHFITNADCNGVAVDGEKVIMTADFGNIICYHKNGDFLWSANLVDPSGQVIKNDAESVPLLADLNADGAKDVVATLEGYGLVAINGKDGSLLWQYHYPYKSGSYMNSPAAYDLNKDGIPDIVFGAKRDQNPEQWDYQNSLFALNGKNGKPLWQYQTNSNIQSSPVVLVTEKSSHIVIAETYGFIHFLGMDGKLQKFIHLLNPDGGVSGLFGTPAFSPDLQVVIGSSWWGKKDGVFNICAREEHFASGEDGMELNENQIKFSMTGRISATAVLADVIKSSKGYEFLIPTEEGELLIYSQQGKLLHRLVLPSGSECTLLVADIDGDKKLEILSADYQGNLNIYRARFKKGKVFQGNFRGGGDNAGVVRL